MKEIKAFITSDGRLFTVQDEAISHEEHLKVYPVIDAFLDSSANEYHGVPQKAIVRKSIALWEKWKEQNV